MSGYGYDRGMLLLCVLSGSHRQYAQISVFC